MAAQVVTSWTVKNGCILRKSTNKYGTNGVVVPYDLVGFRPSNGYSWIELSGNITGSVFNYGYIQQNIATEIGKTYYVYFDIANHPESFNQGSSVTKKVSVFANATSRVYSTTINSTSITGMNWKTCFFKFTATTVSTTIKFMNVSNQFTSYKDIEYGPQLDNVKIVESNNLVDELSSYTTAQSLGIDNYEFNSNFTINTDSSISQIPITLSDTRQSINADFVLDKLDRLHLAYQSNRDNYWNVYYATTRYLDTPFKFDTQITDAFSNSINPSINIDSKGRRLIAWQDNRTGNHQIFAAVCKDEDDMISDDCKNDEVNAFIYTYNENLQPYDPYDSGAMKISCDMQFVFEPTASDLYHFNVYLYEDKTYKTLYKKISSKLNINGWKINGVAINYEGLSASAGDSYAISYTPSAEDDITGRVLYATVEYESINPIVDIANCVNVQVLQAYDGLDLRTARFEDSTNFKLILESDDKSPRKIPTQTASQLNIGKINGIVFNSPLTELPGVSVAQKVQSVLIHYDAVGAVGSSSCIIKFNQPILALILNGYDLAITNDIYGYPGVTYGNQEGTEHRGWGLHYNFVG
jgi:hypothetical protein